MSDYNYLRLPLHLLQHSLASFLRLLVVERTNSDSYLNRDYFVLSHFQSFIINQEDLIKTFLKIKEIMEFDKDLEGGSK